VSGFSQPSGDQNGAGRVTGDASHARVAPGVSPTCARCPPFAIDAIRALGIMRAMVRTAVALARMKPAQSAVSMAATRPQNDTPGRCPADGRPARQWLVVLIVGTIFAPVALLAKEPSIAVAPVLHMTVVRVEARLAGMEVQQLPCVASAVGAIHPAGGWMHSGQTGLLGRGTHPGRRARTIGRMMHNTLNAPDHVQVMVGGVGTAGADVATVAADSGACRLQ
jgi:hypothetical protein